MRNVFSNRELAHVWASRTQDQGKSNNGNFYFSGDTIYSYGSHFPIARFYGDRVLFNNGSYSVTTSQHISHVRGAISHLDKLCLPMLDDVLKMIDHNHHKATQLRFATDYVNDLKGRIERIQEKLPRMRSEYRINDAHAEIANYERAAQFVWVDICKRKSDPFNAAFTANKTRLKTEFKAIFDRIDDSAIAASVASLKADIESGMRDLEAYQAEHSASRVSHTLASIRGANLPKHRRATAAKTMGKAWLKRYDSQVQKQVDALKTLQPIYSELAQHSANLLKLEHAEKIEQWVKGESVYLPRGVPMVLRVKGDNLETSEGASVPLKDAKRLTRLAAACRAAGKPWQRNGETHAVGMYQTDKITAQGDLRVGCHLIPWAAIVECVNRFVPELRDVVAG